MRKIIGITGFAGHGKSTVANIIMNEYPNQWVTISSGSALKDVVSVLFDWPRNMLEGDTLESREFRETKDIYWSNKLNQDWTPRKALQWLGTDIIRNQLSYNFWIDITLKKIESLPSNINVLIPDVRFRNEIDAIRKANGAILRVCLGPLPSWFYDWEKINNGTQIDKEIEKSIIPQGLHSSEYEWIGYDKPNAIIHPDYKDLNLLKKLVLSQKQLIR